MTARTLTAAAHAVDERKARSKQKKLGASDVGTCRRRTGYVLAGVRPTNSPSKMKAILGTWLHKGALHALAREYGALTEVELEDEVLRGHSDAVYVEPLSEPVREGSMQHFVAVDVEDVKTRSVNVWGMFVERGPYLSEWWQVALYADLIRRGKVKRRGGVLQDVPPSALQIRTLRIRGLCRDNGDEHVFERPYTQELADQAWAWLDEVLDSPDPTQLPKDEPGPTSSMICENCPFRDRCWPPRDDGKAPESVIEDALIEGALAEYHEAQQLESAANRRKKAARAMLDAAPAGTYGPFALGWSGGYRPKATPDMELIRRDYADRGEALPMRTSTTSPSISVKKAAGPTPL
jgi:hypothetical protein